jgi:putative DNA primase/helicase
LGVSDNTMTITVSGTNDDHRITAMPNSTFDAETRARNIVEKLGGVWRGRGGECCCPVHADRSPSLSVRLGDKAILFHCYAGCQTADVMGALKDLRLHDRQPLAMPAAKPVRDLGALALRLWRASEPIGGTPAENYLLARGLSGPFSTKLRYNPHTVLGSGPGKQILPAMIAAVENDLGLLAVQRTFLDPNDILRKPLGKSKLALGFLGTGAIRLAPPTEELGLAEGIEDALSAMKWFGTPTWALGGVERLALVDIPASVRRVIVYADRGKAAETLFAKSLDHLQDNGREVINRAPPHHDDWNDAWRAHIARPLRN